MPLSTLRHLRPARRRHRRRGDRRHAAAARARRARCGLRAALRDASRPAPCTTRRRAMRCPTRRFAAARGGARHPLRRDGLARDPPSRRHRDRAAARPALRARALRRRAARRGRSPACRCRSPTRVRATSTSSSCASPPRACSPRVGRGVVVDDREARDTMVITRKRRPSASTSSPSAWPSGAARAAARARSPASTRPTCSRRWRSSARCSTRSPRATPDVARAAPLRRRDGARPRAPALDLRRAGHREHVRRHPLRPGGRARRRHGHGALGRHRRRARRCSSRATARRPTSRARARPIPTAMILSAAMMLDWLGERHGDARLAQAARAHRDARSTRRSPPAACCRSSSAAATARRRSAMPPWRAIL